MQYYWTIFLSHIPVFETHFERTKVGWAPYNLKQHDYGPSEATDNRIDQTSQLLLFCVFILFSGPREAITSTKEKLCSLEKKRMRESILNVSGNPPLERINFIKFNNYTKHFKGFSSSLHEDDNSVIYFYRNKIQLSFMERVMFKLGALL